MGDRLPREKALALGYLIQSGAMAATALSLFVDAPIGVIYLCAALSNCAITLTRPVHHAILPELAETPPELTASNSASSTLEGLSVFIGPVLTGILLAEEGAWLVFAVTSAGVLVAAAMTVGLRRHLALVPAGRVSASIVQDAKEGFRQLREDRGATLLTLLVGAQFVVVGMLDVLAVVLALEILGMGPAGPGLMTAAAGIGGLLGAAGTAVLIGRHRMAPAVAAGMLATGGCLALVAVAPGPAMAAVFLIGCGMGKAFFDVASRTLLQRTVDDEVLSRVFGLQEAMLMAGLAVGSAMAPVFVALFGARGAFVAAGALLPLAGLLSRARLREVDDRARVPGVELDLLRRITLFAPLAQPVLERVSWHLIPLEVGAGEVLMRQGEPGDRFYVIAEGEATVEVDRRDGGAPPAGRLLRRDRSPARRPAHRHRPGRDGPPPARAGSGGVPRRGDGIASERDRGEPGGRSPPTPEPPAHRAIDRRRAPLTVTEPQQLRMNRAAGSTEVPGGAPLSNWKAPSPPLGAFFHPGSAVVGGYAP